MIISTKRITKALIRLRGCAGWSAPVLFAKPRRQVFSRRGPFKEWSVWKEKKKHFCANSHHDSILDKVVSITTNQNAAGVAMMILVGPTCSDHTFSAFHILIYLAQFVSRTAEIIIRISSMTFRSNVYRLLWYCCLFTTSMPHDAHTFNACDERLSGWQDSLMLKLSLQTVGVQSPIDRQSIAE